MALCGHPRTSAFWSLSGVKQTLPGPAKIDANDPERTFAFVDVSNIAQTPLRQSAQAVKRHQDRVPPRPHLCTCAILIQRRDVDAQR
jgi:hypothetical protein